MATAYGTIDEADIYFTDRGGSAQYPEWFAAELADKQTAHVLGTDYVDYRYEPRMTGRRTDNDQLRAYPRTGATRRDLPIGSAEIPIEAKVASYEAAYRHLKGDDLIQDGIDRSSEGEVSETSDALEGLKTSVKYREGSQTTYRRFRIIDRIMRPLLSGGASGSNGMVRLG